MDFQIDPKQFEEAIKVVTPWDFSLTIEKLQEPDYAGWDLERALAAELGYKRYLALTKASGGRQPVPNSDIDRFWHEHILDTRRYAIDCNTLFGEFLHHYPFFGMRGEVDNKNWAAEWQASNAIWLKLFGENLYDFSNVAQKCPQKCPSSPMSFSSPQKCPQSCPSRIESVLAPQKCPQSCPGKSVYDDSELLAA